MQGELLLNLVMVLTPDDVRRMKAAGHAVEAGLLLDDLDDLVSSCRRTGSFGLVSKLGLMSYRLR